jgi:hypothetical protein
MHRRLLATILVASLSPIALVGIATAAGTPKRGTYIDTELQLYIVTTKDVSAVKSFQTTCLRKSATGALEQSGSMTVSRKIRIKPNGGFSYSGKAKIFTGGTSAVIATVRIRASYSGGKFKGTAACPAKDGFEPATFSAKYYGVNPQG